MNWIQEYLNKMNLQKYKRIALYGYGRDCQKILDCLNKDQYEKIYLADRDESKFLGNRLGEYVVCPFSEIRDKIEAVIIASAMYHIAIETRLERQLRGMNVRILSPYKLYHYYPSDELVINKYEKKNAEYLSEEAWIESRDQMEGFRKRLAAYVDEVKQEVPLFKLVEIETYNKCNGSCSFCPVNRMNDTREHVFMEDALFYKIIRELEELRYDGRVSLFSNNEPLLDERIYQFSQYMREHLPLAKIHMYTNGTLFTMEKFLMLVPYLDELIIDNYTRTLTLIKPVEEIRQYCEEHPELLEKVSIVLRKPDEILTSRGGDAPNRKTKKEYKGISCALPFEQMVIRPTGKVSLCCNDALGKYTMGDLSKQSITEVWYGKTYTEVREQILKGRENVEHCKLCDNFTLYL